VISFLVINLINPSFINTKNQQIFINTKSSKGLIESNLSDIGLTPSDLNVTSYTKPTNQAVGTEYNLTLQLSIPDYAKIKSGQIHIIFSPLSTYSNGQISNNFYMGPN
jgi:hypothetical protein